MERTRDVAGTASTRRRGSDAEEAFKASTQRVERDGSESPATGSDTGRKGWRRDMWGRRSPWTKDTRGSSPLLQN
ncbi:hypothetical protein EYF80_057545 [Liparis tanakae]|uniref:Uncharacterized protein n=1 Tax=Liparis tanakae TaxID=230148 RepID=A0A4Z2ETQ1_9TELE|nr:hypothetical protein EYF80_057545 [Liparis tanakae]